MSNGEAERSEAIAEEIAGLLDEVASLDEDRILRSYLTLVRATLRTNYFQQGPAGGYPRIAGPAGARCPPRGSRASGATPASTSRTWY